MKQISGTKRLALGLGVMVLGVLGALPFRHSLPPESVGAEQVTWNSVTLGEGVSLQVPGQTAIAQPAIAQPTAPQLQPTPSDDKAEEKTSEFTSWADLARVSPPPQLPDQYRPLFRPDAPRQSGAGHVLSAGPDAESPQKRLKKHKIRDGDTLTSLALRYLGDGQRADEILAANRTVLTDPEILPIGVQILIPRSAGEAGPARTDDDVPHLVPLPAVDFHHGR